MPNHDGDSHVRKIIDDVGRRRDQGEQISDEEILAAHPDLADKLGEKLKQLGLVANAREMADIDSLEKTVSDWGDRTEISGSLERVEAIRSGDRIRHYVLKERIGAGGFGSVWRARDSKLECDVAIKIPKRELSPKETERFVHEARVSAQLRKHPNIVSVHEATWDDETAFIVSDYVDGASLDERLDQSRIEVNESANMLISICDALQHAHEQGIIHRDLKPANILLDRTGVPHITDFGLAMRVSQLTDAVPGKITGTAAYMSPEQARGESDSADRRSDIFSLGIVFFELLTGERPYRGSIPNILQQIRSDDPPRPRSFDPRIPADLETICLKCLEKDASRRYQSATELSEDLQRYLRREPIHARPASAAGRLLRWSQRNPSIPLLSLSLMFVTLGATWASFRFLKTEVDAMQFALTDRAQQSLELLAKYAADDAELNLALRFNQVRSMVEDLGQEQKVIRQLAEWNGMNEQARDRILEQLRSSKVEDTPNELRRIQQALADLKAQTQDADTRDRTYSFFVCDDQGIQIAREPLKHTLGTDFAFRSYFTGWERDDVEGKARQPGWAYPEIEPRLSDSFLVRKKDDSEKDTFVIAVSAPIWRGGGFQGVAGIFIELGDLVSDPQGADATDKMLIFDSRQGTKDARLIHNQGKEIESIEPVDITQFLSNRNVVKHSILGEGPWRIATKRDPKRELVVMMVEHAKAIETPGKRLRANLVTIGLSVVGFAAFVLTTIWIIILQRVVKT